MNKFLAQSFMPKKAVTIIVLLLSCALLSSCALFKEEREEQEDIRVLHVIEKLTIMCANGDGSTCNDVGVYHNRKLHYKKAREFFTEACDKRNGDGCSNLGFYYVNGISLTKDIALGLDYYQKACEFNYGKGCYNAALMYYKGVRGSDSSLGKTKTASYKDVKDSKEAGESKNSNEPPQNNAQNQGTVQGRADLKDAKKSASAKEIAKGNSKNGKAEKGGNKSLAFKYYE